MESQVEEAQGALARKHTLMQDALERAEAAETTIDALKVRAPCLPHSLTFSLAARWRGAQCAVRWL
eukprot:SAG11_NODE_448_length_9392_cov_17.782978_2_plen_66_part_00